MQSQAALCQTAIDIQDACNPSAVALFYVRVVDSLRNDHNIRGTDEIRKHPAVVLTAHKLADLSQVASLSSHAYYEAYMAANRMIEEHPNPALDALRHHVSGAVARGEAVAITEVR